MIRWKHDVKRWEITCQHCSRTRLKGGNYNSILRWLVANTCELCGKVFLSEEDRAASLMATQMGNRGDGIAILWNIIKETRQQREEWEPRDPKEWHNGR